MTALLGLLFGAVGLLVGAVTGSRATAMAVGISLAIASFPLNALAPLAGWLASWERVSPFYWALNSDSLTAGLDVGMALLLAGTSAVLVAVAVAVLAYRHHDLQSR